MKRILLGALAAVGFAGLTAHAAGTATLNVQANVIGNCQFNTASATMDFGNLDPSSASNATGTASLQFWCTKNATYTLSDDDGANKLLTQMRMKGPGATDYINYSLGAYTTTAQGQGKTTPITVNLSGTVLNTDYVNAAAGAYSDVVTFTINP